MKDINCICLFVKLGLVDQTKCSFAMVIAILNFYIPLSLSVGVIYGPVWIFVCVFLDGRGSLQFPELNSSALCLSSAHLAQIKSNQLQY